MAKAPSFEFVQMISVATMITASLAITNRPLFSIGGTGVTFGIYSQPSTASAPYPNQTTTKG